MANNNIKTENLKQTRKPPMRGGGGHGPMGGGPAEKAKDFKGSLKRLIRYMRPQIPVFILVIIFAALGTAFNIASPKVLANATNALQTGIMKGNLDYDYIIKIIIIVAAMYTISALLSFVSQFLSAGISQKIVYRMRREVKEKLKKLPINYYDTHSSGNILSIITNDIETISNSLQQTITQAVTAILSIIGILIMMLTISGWMTLIAIASLPLFMIITMVIAKKSQKKFALQQNELGSLNGFVEESFASRKVIQLYNKEEVTNDNFEKINDKLYVAGKDAQYLSGIIMPMLRFVNNLSYVAICVVGGILAGAPNPLMIGDIQAFIQYSSQFGQPIMQTANIANTIQSTIAAAERLFNLLDQMDEPKDKQNVYNTEGISGKVEFINVDFSYDKEKELIKNVNIQVESGGTIAIVGPTGAGKTTLVNLLLRFYEIDGGSILIDGKDIRDFAKDDLRSLFGMVLQDTWLESGSIRDNIAYGNHDATMEEIIEAAKKAHIHHYIETLPEGYNTIFNEDVSNISQGQRQLMTIARAILADPKILILDEATSSVDTRTESYIQNAMTAMMVGKTSFVIAHRLSTIRNANIILVMNDGKIIEQGSHNELLKKKGFYYNLYNSQFLVQNN